MTVKQWLDSRVGKGIDDDGAYGFQCMDLYADYQRHCLKVTVKGSRAAKFVWLENAFDTSVFTKIPNTPSFIPQRGDVCVWTNGTYGHIAICEGEGNTNYFVSLDQNWFSPWNGTGKATYVRHNYDGVAGFLRPKKDINFDQAAYNAEQARIAEANRVSAEAARVAAEKAKAAADAAAKTEAERVAKEQKKLAEEQARLEKELAAKLEADKKTEEARIEAERLRVAEEEKKRQEEASTQPTEEIIDIIIGVDMKPRFKSPVVWTAILAQVLLVVGLFVPGISDPVKIVGTALIQTLTLLGILNNPTDPENF